MTLEDAIRQAIAAGGLRHLTLAPSGDHWQAAYKAKSDSGYRVAIHEEPVSAMIEALIGGVPFKPVAIDDDIMDLIG